MTREEILRVLKIVDMQVERAVILFDASNRLPLTGLGVNISDAIKCIGREQGILTTKD